MEYIQGLSSQTSLFLYSLGLGFLLGVLYDVFRTLRMLISNAKGFVIFADVLYFTLCGVISFFFVLVTDEGKLRIYTVLGEVLGWTVYYFSFGAVAIRMSNAAVRSLKRAVNVILKPVIFLKRKIASAGRKMSLFLQKRIRKSRKKSKFILQKHKGIVYNLYGYIHNYKFKNNKGNKDECS